MRYLNVSMDLRTGRLLKLMQAIQLAEEVPKDSARRLVGMARSVRLLTEAGESRLACEVLTDITKMVVGEEMTWTAAIERHCDQVRTILEPPARRS